MKNSKIRPTRRQASLPSKDGMPTVASRRSLKTHSKTRLRQRGRETLSTRTLPEGPGGDESACAEGVPPDRCFDISPEEFCGDPYEQEGHIESRQELGRKGEEAAVRYLKSRGYAIVKRNWFCRFGEADIIARDPEGTLCFIEVKTRQSVEAGLPEEAITRSKQSRYERIALCYMMVTDDWDDNDSVRFDAIAICVTAPHRAMLRHHKGCFNECF